MGPKLKMNERLRNQTVNLETDAKTLYYSVLKLNIVLLYILSTKKTKTNMHLATVIFLPLCPASLTHKNPKDAKQFIKCVP